VNSIGRYGTTPFLVGLYGMSELPQAFCRLCAVYGGMYILRRSAQELHIDKETGKYNGIVDTEGQSLFSNWLVTSLDYVPQQFVDNSESLSRCVCVTSYPLHSGEQQVLFVIPPNSGTFNNKHTITLFQFSHELSVCPKGTYLYHFVCRASSTAKNDLESVVTSILKLPKNPGCVEDLTSPNVESVVLYCVYYNQPVRKPSPRASDLPPNVLLCSDPDGELDCTSSVKEAKRLFALMCPDQEFLPKVPNPEDIVWEHEEQTPEQEDNSTSN